MRVSLTASEQSPNTRTTHSENVMRARGISAARAPPTPRAEATLEAMRFTLTLLFGTIGVLITGGKDPDNSEEVRAVRTELSYADAEIASLKMEIDRLQEELDVCTQGYLCPSCAHSCPSLLELIFPVCSHTFYESHCHSHAVTRQRAPQTRPKRQPRKCPCFGSRPGSGPSAWFLAHTSSHPNPDRVLETEQRACQSPGLRPRSRPNRSLSAKQMGDLGDHDPDSGFRPRLWIQTRRLR